MKGWALPGGALETTGETECSITELFHCLDSSKSPKNRGISNPAALAQNGLKHGSAGIGPRMMGESLGTKTFKLTDYSKIVLTRVQRRESI